MEHAGEEEEEAVHKSNIYGLADVFENFRKTTLEYYKLEPCNYVGLPVLRGMLCI
jgi:hypothetical protein